MIDAPSKDRRHLLSMEDVSVDDINNIMRLADSFAEVSSRPIPKVPALRGKTIALAFFEESTRTRLSFESAAKRLSADIMSFSVSSSSVKKGESLRDTIQTVDAMGLDLIVVRHPSAGAALRITQWSSASVVNAGDGAHQHPTQALLDCYTLRECMGLGWRQRGRGRGDESYGSGSVIPPTPVLLRTPDQPDGQFLDGLRIAIVGDVRHSRVARSNVIAFSALGAHVTLVGPPTLMPTSLDGWPVEVTHNFDDVIGDADVIYMLRIQAERTEESLVPSLREYTARWGLTSRRARALLPSSVVMHPGPMNRGVEIASDVADLPVSTITAQVHNGIAVRMGVFFLLAGSADSVHEHQMAVEVA